MGYSAQSITVFELISDIKNYYLPAIQREFVWPAAKIESLFDSLLRGYPIGTMLRWDVREPSIHSFPFYDLLRDYDIRAGHNAKANLSALQQCFGILDGQQRITSLYIGLSGSYIDKLPRLWWNNPDAFPKKRLYINLLFRPGEVGGLTSGGQRYQIKFLTDDQAREQTDQADATAYWFLVGDVLKYRSAEELRAFRRSTKYKDEDVFADTLDTLWKTIHQERNVTFFAETRQELDEVLEIFVRLNTGGTPLSYSDLLLSLATATWKNQDAREQVYSLVDHLNKQCGSFLFNKDFVLKAILVLSGGDVRFRTINVSKNDHLEGIWKDVSACLKTTVRLLRDFGLDGRTLTAPYAALPIAYYLYVRGLAGAGDGFLNQSAYQADRAAIRSYLFKVLLARVFGSGTDGLLAGLRDTVRKTVLEDKSTLFPADAIFHYLAARRGFAFNDEQIKAVVSDTRYGDPYAFATLALLFPDLNFRQSQYHIDHLYPASLCQQKKLQAAKMTSDDVRFALDHYNDLANLHLLVGSDNVARQNKPLNEWLAERNDAAHLRQASLIPDNVDLSLGNFRAFYDARRTLLIKALTARLASSGGPTSTTLANALSPGAVKGVPELTEDDLVTGEPDLG